MIVKRKKRNPGISPNKKEVKSAEKYNISEFINLTKEGKTHFQILSLALKNILALPPISNIGCGRFLLKPKRSQILFNWNDNAEDIILAYSDHCSGAKCSCGVTCHNYSEEIIFPLNENFSIRLLKTPDANFLYVPLLCFDRQVSVLNLCFNKDASVDPEFCNFLKDISLILGWIIQNMNIEEDLFKLTKAINNSLDHIFITDADGRIEYANSAFEEFTGYSCEDWRGKTPVLLKSGVPENNDYRLLWETISAGSNYKGIILNRKKNGDLYYEEKTISPIMDHNGVITDYISVGRDITERIKTEKELRAFKEKAEMSDKIKNDFLTQMSHEIRTPLNSILNFISLLKSELPESLKAEVDDYFKFIDSGSHRLIRTIDLILNMSQIQAGQLTTKNRPIELNKDILENMISEFSNQLNNKEIKLEYHNSIGRAEITGDIYTVRQIFNNLIDNAIKFTVSGSINVVVEQHEEFILVNIIDSGIGMSDNYIDRLFEPFSQEETGYTRTYEGNGLGLALTKKYAEVNNAAIIVKSAKGKGTKVTVRFKRSRPLDAA